jgi:hypothetical protein
MMMSSCSEDNACSAVGRTMLKCNVYTYEEDKTVSKVAIVKLTITAFETDSVIINAQANVQEMLLPLRYTKETTVFVLHYGDEGEQKDTILIGHHNTSQFVSLECGYDMQQTVTDVTYTRHVLDSISVRNINLDVNVQENFRLFYIN